MKFREGDLIVSLPKRRYLFTESTFAIFRVEEICDSTYMIVKLFSFINEKLYYKDLRERMSWNHHLNGMTFSELKRDSLRPYRVRIDSYKLYNPRIIWD